MFGLSGRVVATAATNRPAGLTRSATDPGLLTAWKQRTGAAADLPLLLRDLDRCARPFRPRFTRAASAFCWDEDDSRTRAWVPQGVSTSADAYPTGTVDGRQVLAASWYSPKVAGRTEGARVTFVDLTAPERLRYRHVLLVEAAWEAGALTTLPVPVHAGGIVWYDDLLYVASTFTGLRVFDLADLVRVDPAEHGGHGFLLPQRWAYRPVGDPAERLRFSFVSVDRTAMPHCLVAGEYGRRAATRLARFELAAGTSHLCRDDETVFAAETFVLAVPSMQGVARVDGTYFVSASRGRFLRGDLWVGRPERGFRAHRCALPVGPEDLTAWPARTRLWSLTEWAGRRMVFALRSDDWPGPV